MGTQPTTSPEWVGIPELADHLGVARNAIRRHVADGRIPYVRIGRQYRSA